MTTHTDPENYKIKVYNAGAARLELPFVGRAIGQPISAANMAKAFNKIEKCLQQLGVSQCPVCEQPQGPSGYCGLGGICPDCWAEHDGLDEVCDLSTLTDHEIGRHWRKHNVFDLLANGHDMGRRPWHLDMLCGMEGTLGDRLASALANWSTGMMNDRLVGYWSPLKLSWRNGVGLVPVGCRKTPRPGEFTEWRKFWQRDGAGFKKAFVRFADLEKEAA
jgi:hypothetical protein